MPTGTSIAMMPTVCLDARSLAWLEVSQPYSDLPPAESKKLYTAIAKKRPSTILALNHEVYGESLEYICYNY